MSDDTWQRAEVSFRGDGYQLHVTERPVSHARGLVRFADGWLHIRRHQGGMVVSVPAAMVERVNWHCTMWPLEQDDWLPEFT